MEKCMGLLKIKIVRGISLAKRDARSSDPYVVVRMRKQKVRTRVVKKNVNPEWNEELTLSIYEPIVPIVVLVYDKDTFTSDDKMGYAEFDIKPIVDARKMPSENVPNGTVIAKVNPTRQNCLAEESSVMWKDGFVTQHMFLRLKNVECGEVELQLKWIDISAFTGLNPQLSGPAATGSITGGAGKDKKSEKLATDGKGKKSEKPPKPSKAVRKRGTSKMRLKWRPRSNESANESTNVAATQNVEAQN